MKFNVMNRHTGGVQFTAKIDCAERASISWNVRLAVLWAIKNDTILRGANLSGADLSDTILRGADLSDTILRGANLSGADLLGADLSYADLRGADLRGANLRYADLLGADLSYADLRGAILRGADLSGADLSGANLRDTILRGADLSGADLSGANLRGAILRGADLSGAKGYILGPQRTDGYRFDARLVNDKWRVVAGCRTSKNWTTDQYRKHTEIYEHEQKRKETLAILDYLDARAAMEKTND